MCVGEKTAGSEFLEVIEAEINKMKQKTYI